MKKWPISSEHLKIFALITMTADHIDRIFNNTQIISHTLGRMAFPIFAFLLITNFCKYHPVKKYLARLSIFAILTQGILLTFSIPTNNILFTFLYAVGFLSFTEQLQKKYNSYEQCYYLIFAFLLAAPFIALSAYGLFGFFFLLALYAYIQKPTPLNYAAVLTCSTAINFKTPVTIGITLATVILLLSCIKIIPTQKRTKWWLFYLYYPLHLVILKGIATLIEQKTLDFF